MKHLILIAILLAGCEGGGGSGHHNGVTVPGGHSGGGVVQPVHQVPEPPVAGLLAIGVVGLLLWVGRR